MCHFNNASLVSLVTFLYLINIVISSEENEVCHKFGSETSCESPPAREKCRHFDPSKFGVNSKSIFYGEANGRFGNQLLG